MKPVVTAHRQAGLSLIELLVGLAIGMLLVSGLLLVYANTSRSSSELDKSVQHIENGRYAMDLLDQDISLAGYYGSVPTLTASSAIPACSDTADLLANLRTIAVEGKVPPGIQGLSPTQATTQLAASTCLGTAASIKAGTPALVVRRLDTEFITPGDNTKPATTSNVLYVQASHNLADIGDNTYLGNASYIANLGTGSVTTDATTFNLRAVSTTKPNPPVRRMVSRIYFISTCNICSGTAADTVPTLKVAEMTSTVTKFTISPLAEGIDMIGFDYGVDTDGDGKSDQWVGFNAATDPADMSPEPNWGDVVAVRVRLVSRTAHASLDWQDTNTYPLGSSCTGTTPACTTRNYTPTEPAFKRKGYSNTVRLQSWAGLREK